METRFGQTTVTYSARGVPTYRVEAFHDGLHKYYVIRAGDQNTIRNKAQAQALLWNSAWKKMSAIEQHARLVESRKETAFERTTEAQRLLKTLQETLISGIELDPTLDWEQLKIRAPFPKDVPAKPVFADDPLDGAMPPEPNRSDPRYEVTFSLLDRLLPSRKAQRQCEAENRYAAAMKSWRDKCEALTATRRANAALQDQYVQAVHEWEQERFRYLEEQARQHDAIDGLRMRYESKSPEAVVEYCERVLANSDYPDCIPREFDFELNQLTGVLLVESKLPAPADLPRLAEVKYVKTTDTLTEKFLSEAQIARLYDDLLYQITLRTIHELFQSDSARAISTVRRVSTCLRHLEA